MVADAAHHLMPAIPQSAVAQYLNDRVANGFNTVNIYGMCAGSGTCPTNGAANDGTPPFTIGADSSTWDISSHNAAYWAEVDNVITQAGNLGLVVLFDPIPWGVDFGTTMENITGPVNYPTSDFNFGVFLGNRYKNSPNIIWQFGQDFRHGGGSVNGQWLPADQNFLDYMSQVIAGVASVDSNHLITTQMNFNSSYTQQGYQIPCNANCTGGVYWNPRFGNANNVSLVYTYYETYDEVLQAYNCGPSGACTMQANNGTVSTGGNAGNAPSTQLPPSLMPAFLGESNYETANNTGLLSPPSANAFITRLEMWWTMTSGGAGHEFGNEHVNHFDSSWMSNLDTTATLQVKHLTTLFNQLQWWNLVPDQTHQVVTAGYGAYNASNGNLYSATYATTAWNPNGTLAIVYTPVSTTLKVNMAKFSASSVTATWYDPTTGASTVVGSFPNSGSQSFTTPPGTHTDGTGANDWVLVLQ
jgi:hypothetical protein